VAKIALTDVTLKTLPLPLKGQKSYWDAAVPGFGVRVSQGGAKTFVVLDPRARVRVAESIGRYPRISLQDARQDARRRLAEATLGKGSARPVRASVAIKSFLSESDLKERTRKDYRLLLNRLRLGETKLADVKPADLEKRLSIPGMYPVARAFFKWAYRKHYVDVSPMARMKAPAAYAARERVLSADELNRIWRACPDDAFGRVVKLLILTGQRRGEISGLSSIGADRLTFADTKNGRAHSIPLGDKARDVAVLPLKFTQWDKAKKRLDEESGVSDWTLHDLRRTFASGLAALGVQLHVIERLLNHLSGSFKGVVGVYQRYDFWPEMSAAIWSWELHLLAVLELSGTQALNDPDLSAMR